MISSVSTSFNIKEKWSNHTKDTHLISNLTNSISRVTVTYSTKAGCHHLAFSNDLSRSRQLLINCSKYLGIREILRFTCRSGLISQIQLSLALWCDFLSCVINDGYEKMKQIMHNTMKQFVTYRIAIIHYEPKKMFQAQERSAYNYSSTSNNNFYCIKCVMGYAERISEMNMFAAA